MLDKYKKTVDTGLARSASRSIPRTWNAMCSSSCNEETSYRIAFGHFRSTVHVLCLSIGDPTYQKKIECSRRRKNRNQCPMRAMWSLPVLDLSIGKYNVLAYIRVGVKKPMSRKIPVAQLKAPGRGRFIVVGR